MTSRPQHAKEDLRNPHCHLGDPAHLFDGVEFVLMRRESLLLAAENVQQVDQLVLIEIQVRDLMPDKLARRSARPKQNSKALKPLDFVAVRWLRPDPI